MWGWLAFLPVIFLVKHVGAGHLYLPMAGFAIFIGALIEEVLARTLRTTAREAVGVAVLAGLWLWLVYPAFMLKLSWPAAIWVKNQATLSNLKSLYPHLPANAHLYIYPLAPGALFESGNGASVRLIYGQQIAVTAVGRLEELGNALGGEPAKTVGAGDKQDFHLLHYNEQSGDLEDMVRLSGSFDVPVPTEKLQLTRLDPEGTSARKLPDAPSAGHAAVMAYGRNITPDTVVVWQGTELQTAYRTPKWIIALVPNRFLTGIGECEIFLHNKTGASNKLRFMIKP
jgi:hypothetical protein